MLRCVTGEAVEHKLLELLGDPDEGVILREDARARLQRTLEAERAGKYLVWGTCTPYGAQERLGWLRNASEGSSGQQKG